jgi:hypothetical protein
LQQCASPHTWRGGQGDCQRREPKGFAKHVVPLARRQCRVSVRTQAFKVDAPGARLWLSTLALTMQRDDDQRQTFDPLLTIAGDGAQVWMTDMALLGDKGLAAGLQVAGKANVYVSGARSARCSADSITGRSLLRCC